MRHDHKIDRGWKVLRVFISSTFIDMESERDHLVRFVFPKLQQDLLRWRVHLLDIDLRWGVTAEQDSLDICKRVIEECRPRFICILGGRYGSIRKDNDKSYTALEIEYSLSRSPTQECPKDYRFFYFRNSGIYKSIPLEDIDKAGLLEKDPHISEKLEALKNHIRSSGFIPRIYPADWDSNLKCLVGLEIFGAYVYADLLWSVIDELGEDIPDKLNEFSEENAAMETFAQDRVSHFIAGSRRTLINDITSFAEANNGKNILALVGKSGSGKSALLSRFYLDYKQQHPKELVIGHFIGASHKSANLIGILRRICHEMNLKEQDPPENVGDLVKRFATTLAEVSEHIKVILIIDGLNQMDNAFNANEMNWLPSKLPEKVRIIISSIDDKEFRILQEVGEIKIVQLDPLSKGDRAAIIDDFLDRYKKAMDNDQKESLLQKAESCLPLYLFIALEELRTLGKRDEMDHCLQELPGDVQTLFRWILKERLSNDHGFIDGKGNLIGEKLTRDFSAFLASSRYGLTQEEIVDLIDPIDKKGNVAALQRLLRPYLMFRGDRIDFYHDQFRQAVIAEYLISEETRQSYHIRLANYFKKAPSSRIHRLTEEYPYQLMCCKNEASLAGSLSNLGLFYSAWKQGLAHEWMGYWRSLPEWYDPNVWYSIACSEEEKAGRLLTNGWIYHILGWFLMEMEIYKNGDSGNYDTALMMFSRSLYIHKNIVGLNNPSIAEILNGIATIYAIQGKPKLALELLEQVLTIRVSTLGPTHHKVAVTLNNIGLIYYKQGNWQEALSKYQNALEIYEAGKNKIYAESADTYNNLGLICKERGSFESALENYNKALEIMNSFFELYSPNKSTVLANQGDLYCCMGDYKKAIEYYTKAIKIAEKPPYDRRASEFKKKLDIARNNAVKRT